MTHYIVLRNLKQIRNNTICFKFQSISHHIKDIRFKYCFYISILDYNILSIKNIAKLLRE